MAFFDNNIFSPQTYQGGMSNWLVDALRSGLLGRAIPQQDQPTSMGNYGGVQYPVFGQAPQQPATNELSAQAVQQPMAPEPQQDFISRLQSNISPGWAQLNAGGKPTDDIREYEYAKRQGFSGSFTDYMQRKRVGAGEFGLNPIFGTDAEGNTAFVQPGKSGTAIQGKLPPGFKIARDPLKVDLGTHWGFIDPQSRQMVTTIPKELAKAKEQEKFGTLQGEAKGELASQTSKMPGLEKVVSHLDTLSEKATYTIAGQAVDYAKRQLNMEPREASVARVEYEAVVNNQILPLLRDTFGAQFTEREGATLRATLGDPNKSPKEKQAVLRSFIEQKQRDIEALQRRTGERPATESAPAAPPVAKPLTARNKAGQRIMLDRNTNQWVPYK
jgi:hypothetical protein